MFLSLKVENVGFWGLYRTQCGDMNLYILKAARQNQPNTQKCSHFPLHQTNWNCGRNCVT